MKAKLFKKEEKDIQIGLDIGSHSVKAVAISYAKSPPRLLSFSVKPVADNIIKAIKDAHAELGLTKRKVIASISGPAVIIRYVELPSMTDEELRGATRFEAEKIIPYNIDEVILDSAKIEDLSDNRMRVVIVAAKKDLVDTQIKILNEAELEPLILDIDSFAVMNAFISAGTNPNDICALLNIGAKTSNLNIVRGSSSYFSRDIDIGGNDITKAVAESLSLKEPEQKPITDALENMLSRLADELRLSFDFYENHYTGSINKIYISGGTSKSAEVEKYLKEDLGCDVLKWDPFAGMELAPGIDTAALEESKVQLAIAAGLALRRAEE